MIVNNQNSVAESQIVELKLSNMIKFIHILVILAGVYIKLWRLGMGMAISVGLMHVCLHPPQAWEEVKGRKYQHEQDKTFKNASFSV